MKKFKITNLLEFIKNKLLSRIQKLQRKRLIWKP